MKFTKVDNPIKTAAAINFIVNALLILNPPYKLIDKIVPDIHNTIRDMRPIYPSNFNTFNVVKSGNLFAFV